MQQAQRAIYALPAPPTSLVLLLLLLALAARRYPPLRMLELPTRCCHILSCCGSSRCSARGAGPILLRRGSDGGGGSSSGTVWQQQRPADGLIPSRCCKPPARPSPGGRHQGIIRITVIPSLVRIS